MVFRVKCKEVDSLSAQVLRGNPTWSQRWFLLFHTNVSDIASFIRSGWDFYVVSNKGDFFSRPSGVCVKHIYVYILYIHYIAFEVYVH